MRIPLSLEHVSDSVIREMHGYRLELLGVMRVVPSHILALVAAHESGALQVVFSAEALQKMKLGDWTFLEAKDGSGLLPTLVGPDGKFVQQVHLKAGAKLSPSFANTMQHAATHQMLRQILAKLDVLDEKLDDLLRNQADAWRGRLAFAIRDFERHLREPVPGALENIKQTLSENQGVGTSHVQRRVDKLQVPTGWALFFSQIKGAKLTRTCAVQLDELMQDLLLLHRAAEVHGRILVLDGQPLAAADELQGFIEVVQKYQRQTRRAYAIADYDSLREYFWQDAVPRFHLGVSDDVAFEFSAKELLSTGTP